MYETIAAYRCAGISAQPKREMRLHCEQPQPIVKARAVAAGPVDSLLRAAVSCVRLGSAYYHSSSPTLRYVLGRFYYQRSTTVGGAAPSVDADADRSEAVRSQLSCALQPRTVTSVATVWRSYPIASVCERCADGLL
jgi:hypothetical protein